MSNNKENTDLVNPSKIEKELTSTKNIDYLIDKVKGNGIGIRIETGKVNLSVWDTSKEVITKWETIKTK